MILNVSGIESSAYKLQEDVIKDNIKVAKAGQRIDKHMLDLFASFGIKKIQVYRDVQNAFSIDNIVDDVLYFKLHAAIKNEVNIDMLYNGCKELVSKVMQSNTLSSALSLIATKQSEHDKLINHCINTAVYAAIITLVLNKDKTVLNNCIAAGLLHDIGKLSIPDSVLFTADKLTKAEDLVVKQHPLLGYNMLAGYNLDESIKLGVLQHHENHDGTGYPNKLKGDEISEIGAILHIADVYDALTIQRDYKDSWSTVQARNYIIENSGTLFNPVYVDIFSKSVPMYTRGAFVELLNGEKAIILKNVYEHTLDPVVVTLKNGQEIRLDSSDLYIKNTIQPDNTNE